MSLLCTNEIEVAELERRCRPIKKNSDFSIQYDDVEIARCEEENDFVAILRSMRSHCGFLSFEEKISDVVAQDLASLDSLNIDKQILVQELRSLIAKFNLQVSKPTPMTTIEIVVHRDENHVFGSKSTYCVTRLIPKGLPQRSPFVNLETDSPDSCWSVEYHVRNTALPHAGMLKIAGDEIFGAIEMIEKYNFFGGGSFNQALKSHKKGFPFVQNNFRLDPNLVYSILLGSLNDSSRSLLLDKTRFERNLLLSQIVDANKELTETRQALASTNDAVEQDMLKGEVLMCLESVNSLQRQLQEVDAKMEKLKEE